MYTYLIYIIIVFSTLFIVKDNASLEKYQL